MGRVWVGVDAGNGFHWAVAIDEEGEVLISRKAHNGEADLSALLEEVLSFGVDVVWATDQPGGSAALLLALLWERDQRVTPCLGVSLPRAVWFLPPHLRAAGGRWRPQKPRSSAEDVRRVAPRDGLRAHLHQSRNTAVTTLLGTPDVSPAYSPLVRRSRRRRVGLEITARASLWALRALHLQHLNSLSLQVAGTRLARVDPKLLYPLKHRGEDSQAPNRPSFACVRRWLVAARSWSTTLGEL